MAPMDSGVSAAAEVSARRAEIKEERFCTSILHKQSIVYAKVWIRQKKRKDKAKTLSL